MEHQIDHNILDLDVFRSFVPFFAFIETFSVPFQLCLHAILDLGYSLEG